MLFKITIIDDDGNELTLAQKLRGSYAIAFCDLHDWVYKLYGRRWKMFVTEDDSGEV